MDETSSSRALGLLMERICRSSALLNELINPVGEPVAEVIKRFPSQAGARTLALAASSMQSLPFFASVFFASELRLLR
jgi:hypothetical protein